MKYTLLLILSTAGVAFAQQGHQKGSPSWERVSRHDADNDGKVTKLEFKGPEMAFTRFDSNKDGSITEEEMKSVSPKGRKGEGKGQGERGGGKGKKADNAPAVGDTAPQLKAQKLGSTEMVDLGNIKKPTVLIFGSYT